jgi:hypothetical protein
MRIPTIAAVLLLGCGGSSNGGSDGTTQPTDAGSSDAPALPHEAGRQDAAPPDAGPPDAGPPDAAPHEAGPPVQDCVAVPSGQWQEITPPDLHREWWCTPDFNPAGCGGPGDTGPNRIATYGAHYFALAPSAPGTIYLGTSSLGLWRSTDCGAHWVLADGGGTPVDAGRNWTIAVDPNDAQTLYTTAGYGTGGVYKSTNGGASWTQILPPKIEAVASFVEKIAMDPGNPDHLTVSFHDACLQSATTPDLFSPGTALAGNLPAGAPQSKTSGGMAGWGCLAETTDAGAHWTLVANALAWEGLDGPGQAMASATTWFYASNSPTGIFLTTTGGRSPDGKTLGWTKVVSGSVPGSVYVAPDHTYYSSNGGHIIHSSNGVDWSPIPGDGIGLSSFNGSTPFVQGGSRLYGAVFSFTPPARYFVSDVTNPNFGPLSTDASAIPNGAANLDYDSRYGILYSSNMVGGLWRLKP